MYNYRFRFFNCRSRRGLSTIVGIAVLAIVGSTIILLAQTIIREQHNNAWKLQIIQANLLVDDLYRIAEKRKQNISVTIPASELRGVADFHITATAEGENVTVTGEYAAEELPANRHYSTQKQSIQKQK
ncbi:MAG: hypothetical protein LBG58_12390 [Planctomycetaceae bacterium]|jgi:hypothetical protein|nr:hypothetical protein [Planctomycetaceae bacterium]